MCACVCVKIILSSAYWNALSFIVSSTPYIHYTVMYTISNVMNV